VSTIRDRYNAAGVIRPGKAVCRPPAPADPGAERRTARFKSEAQALNALLPPEDPRSWTYTSDPKFRQHVEARVRMSMRMGGIEGLRVVTNGTRIA
jgi:hypothetical protein